MVDNSRIFQRLVKISKMESDEDWFPGKFLDDGFCELYALVIWKSFDESKYASQFCCMNVEKILNPQMFIDSKLYGHIRANVVHCKGYKLGVYEHWFLGRVLTTGGNL